jgi:hypothetical protein
VTSNTDATWVNRAKKAILLIRILVGWVFLSEGIQKFLFPESLGWPLCEDRHSVAAAYGSFRWSHGDHLRRASLSWSLYPPCLCAPAHRYLRCLVLDQDRHVREERLLGHAARSPHGCEHAAWPDLPIDRRWRNSGPRCALPARAGPKLRQPQASWIRDWTCRPEKPKTKA